MKITSHVRKWERFDALRSRFDAEREFELWYWATLSGGTSLINAALHAAGVTEENDLFATQMPDVYAIHEGPGFWRHVLATRCDLIHVGLPEIQDPLPEDIAKAFAEMERIEDHRDPCVRADRPVTDEVIGRCDASYRAIVEALRDRVHRAAAAVG
jgi:hypothetical protein